MTTHRTERPLTTSRRLAVVGTTVTLLLGGAGLLLAAPGKRGVGDYVCAAARDCGQVHNKSQVSILTAEH
jgi:hypothetical protein